MSGTTKVIVGIVVVVAAAYGGPRLAKRLWTEAEVRTAHDRVEGLLRQASPGGRTEYAISLWARGSLSQAPGMEAFAREAGERFDCGIFSFCLHEMNPSTRAKALASIASMAEQVIIADFARPRAENLWGITNTLTESLSNFTHFSNYLNYTVFG